MARFPRTIFALALPFVGMVNPSPVWATEDSSAFGPGYSAGEAQLGAPAELRIDLRGEVRPRCRMTSVPSFSGRLDFNRSGDAQSRFGLDCNAPFLFSVRSGEGGFAARGMQQGAARLIPYEISVDIDTDSGRNALGWCRSDQLADRNDAACVFGASGWSSGDATAINRTGSFSVRWSAQSEGQAPALGKYRDTIVVDVAVRA